jgi:hypothetical protein
MGGAELQAGGARAMDKGDFLISLWVGAGRGRWKVAELGSSEASPFFPVASPSEFPGKARLNLRPEPAGGGSAGAPRAEGEETISLPVFEKLRLRHECFDS